MKICDVCKQNKSDSELLIVNFRFHLPCEFGKKVGYRKDICKECLKKLNLFREIEE